MSESLLKRLERIDEKILELEELYVYMKAKEEKEGQVRFLPSNALRHRIEKFEIERKNIRNRMRALPSARETYEIELEKRARVLHFENKRLEELKAKQLEILKQQAQANPQFGNLAQFANSAHTSLAVIGKEIISQETRIRNRQRAYDNWVVKKKEVIRRVVDKRSYDSVEPFTREEVFPEVFEEGARIDAADVLDNLDAIPDEPEEALYAHDNFNILTHAGERAEVKPENNASISLISSPGSVLEADDLSSFLKPEESLSKEEKAS